MKISFINPVLGGDYSALDIGITALASYLNQRTAHKARICDLTFNRGNWKDFLGGHIKENRPDIIAVSATTLYMSYIRQIVKELKTVYHLPVVIGGYHASIYPEEILDMEGVDFVCVGDGEYVLAALMDRLENGLALTDVPGLGVKYADKTAINPGGSFIKDIDSLPIANWDLWQDLDKYFYFLGMLYFIGSRGCPYQCSYCDAVGISQAVKGNYYRLREPEGYAREIAFQWDKYRNRSMRLAQLFDPVFTMDLNWLSVFCREYKRLGLFKELRFSAFSRVDHLDEEKIKMLGESGCAILRVGVEAGDDFIRDEIYGKRISCAKIKSIFELCRKYKIALTAYYMLGGPAETRETINKTIKLARELKASRSAFFIYKPFTEAGIRQVAEHGGRIDQKLWRAADNITFDAVVEL
ncbi:MAG TPA: hypothetical protein DEQ77_03985, partial [Candidatus Omnitrophica bacterium]|nr:hypothetical protein [Candidatus Omnitrophota bacterium]